MLCSTFKPYGADADCNPMAAEPNSAKSMRSCIFLGSAVHAQQQAAPRLQSPSRTYGQRASATASLISIQASAHDDLLVMILCKGTSISHDFESATADVEGPHALASETSGTSSVRPAHILQEIGALLGQLMLPSPAAPRPVASQQSSFDMSPQTPCKA